MAKKFPTFGVILLVIGVVWLLSELGIVIINVPWIPLLLIVVAIGIIFNAFQKK